MFLMGMIFILLLAWAAFAQQPQETPVFRADVTMVRVDAQVLEGKHLLGGLTKEDFLVFDEGQPQKIVYFGRESEPVDLVLLLDVSGSIRRYVRQMASAARDALRQLKADDRVAIMLFSRRSAVREEFTTNLAEIEKELREAVREKGLGSGTRINASIISAARYVHRQQRGSGRRAILVLTDSIGLNYQVPDEKVLRALYEADSVLNAMVVGRGEQPKPPKPGIELNPDFTPSDVFHLAEETGGEAVKARRADTSFREMMERLRTRYSIHYRAPGTGSFRRIRVELSPEARRRHPRAVVRARSGYYADN
jgi:Ca-activated chloride channel family protein